MIDNKRIEIARTNEEKTIKELLDSCYPGVKRFFVLAYDDTKGDNQVSVDSFKKYFLPRVKIKIATLKLMEETFMISQLMTQLNIMLKSEKYQQGRVMIIQLVFIGFCLFQKQLQINCSWFKQTKSFRC